MDENSQEMLQLLSDVRETFATPQGKRVLLHILEESRVWGSVFTGNSKTYYLSGQQDLGGSILNLVMNADLAIYMDVIRMRINKNVKEEEADDAAKRSERGEQ